MSTTPSLKEDIVRTALDGFGDQDSPDIYRDKHLRNKHHILKYTRNNLDRIDKMLGRHKIKMGDRGTVIYRPHMNSLDHFQLHYGEYLVANGNRTEFIAASHGEVLSRFRMD